MELTNISKAVGYSEELIGRIRSKVGALSSALQGCAVVTVGSIARREASEQSDIDYFVIGKENGGFDEALKELGQIIEGLGISPPAANGAFGGFVTFKDFIEPIGGSTESNEALTRRMLFLLESDWLFGQDYYLEIFDAVIERYIRDSITQHQLARYFLNDLIRYYRTMCVDFEYKTLGCGKSWGDRNIKLMFSRKLLYFSGVLAAAQTAQLSCKEKRQELKKFLLVPPIKRLIYVCGSDADSALRRYDQFVGWLADEDCRRLLRETTDDRSRQSEEFRTMKNAAHHFAWDLEVIFQRAYPRSHPIHQAIFV